MGSLVVAAEPPPNIIVVMADDVGYEALGVYGGESYETPHLDALANSGLRGMHCYSMPVCHPTRNYWSTWRNELLINCSD